MIWKALVKEHNLGAVIYIIEIRATLNLIKRVPPLHPIMSLLTIQQRKEKDYCII